MKSRYEILGQEGLRKIYGPFAYKLKDRIIIERYGKYEPCLTFVLPKSFRLDENRTMIDPLEFKSTKNPFSQLGLEDYISGKVEVLHGNFWYSPKGTACFEPKDKSQSSHTIIRIDWDKSEGTTGIDPQLIDNIKAPLSYFRRACNTACDTGYDYVIIRNHKPNKKRKRKARS